MARQGDGMASPTGNRDKRHKGRAGAFGALLRSLRRDRGWSLAELAVKIPMSASNLSRLELGNQSPPATEQIESIAAVLGADASELLHAAGRTAGRQSFEEKVLERLDAIGRDVQEVKKVVERKRK
jgi:transcriptional regulator with XRE-family HTH domain